MNPAGRLAAGAIASVMALGALVLPAGSATRAKAPTIPAGIVQVGPMFRITDQKTGKRVISGMGWATGAIVTEDGFVLTSTQAVDLAREQELTNQVEFIQGQMAIFAQGKPEEPTVAIAIADIVLVDERTGLAVLRIARKLDGSPTDPSFRYASLSLGDAIAAKSGDAVNAFGYPGLGGTRIARQSGRITEIVADRRSRTPSWFTADLRCRPATAVGPSPINEVGSSPSPTTDRTPIFPRAESASPSPIPTATVASMMTTTASRPPGRSIPSEP